MTIDYSGNLLPVPTSSSLTAQARFHVGGLSCAADAVRLERHLARKAGVVHVTVNPVNEVAYITFDPVATSTAAVQRAVEHEGFLAREDRGLTPSGSFIPFPCSCTGGSDSLNVPCGGM